jgi:dipeptide/tripeptide permease
VIIHLAVMIAACLALPLHIATGWGKPPEVGEAFWLLGLFAVSIGLPFFALAANSPLLQAWFARTDHPAAKDPYFLYAASNVGSFLALLAYPTMIEPLIRLSDQTRYWSAGFVVLIILIAGCGVLLWLAPGQSQGAQVDGDTDAAVPTPAPTWRDVGSWVALAAVPAGLLVAVTAHISTDVAAVPLLWVLPLALYLATFVIVFARRPIIPHWLVVNVQPLFILGLVAVLIFEPVKVMVD